MFALNMADVAIFMRMLKKTALIATRFVIYTLFIPPFCSIGSLKYGLFYATLGLYTPVILQDAGVLAALLAPVT